MKQIRFTITIKNEEHTGTLTSSDITKPPKSFFIHTNSYYAGDLICKAIWSIRPNGSLFGKLSEKELQAAADYLGNIAVEGYESLFF